jgi:hypothetical protein
VSARGPNCLSADLVSYAARRGRAHRRVLLLHGKAGSGGIAYAGSVGPVPALGDSPARHQPHGVGHQLVKKLNR